MTDEHAVTSMVEAARDGDAAAWNRLVERYLPLVVAVAGRYRLNADEVADVSQTLWLRLVEHLDGIREPRALPGWIVTTTRNEAFRLIKTRNRTLSIDPLSDCCRTSATRHCVRACTSFPRTSDGSCCCCWPTPHCHTTRSASSWTSLRAASDRPARDALNNYDARRR
jgi:RNA polymerase sigma factor (sigma-70 family)